jgi:hypothetical protein
MIPHGAISHTLSRCNAEPRRTQYFFREGLFWNLGKQAERLVVMLN